MNNIKGKKWYLCFVLTVVFLSVLYVLQNNTYNTVFVFNKNIFQKAEYRVIENLANINGRDYFLICKKESDCSPFVAYEEKDTYVMVKNSPVIHDLGFTISPNKRRIAYIETVNVNNQYGLFIFDIEKGEVVKINSDTDLKPAETVACEVGSYGADGYSCGRWLSDTEYQYGVYEKTDAIDAKFKMIIENVYREK
jgi:hypothetical protein